MLPITILTRRRRTTSLSSQLVVDFTSGSLDPRITFSRASSATYYNSAGLVTTVGNNVARFDYNPETLVLRGLLIEEARTNVLNWSQTFATSGGTQNNWVDSASLQRVSTTRTSPDGTGNALEIKANAADQTIISSAAAGSSAQRVFSVFLKRVTGTGDIQYTLDNGATWTTQAITGSWLRYEFPATTANQQVGIRIRTSGDVVQIWGAQLEAGACPSSYIPTTSASAQRLGDLATISPVTPWFSATAGTLYAQFIHRCPDAANNRGITALDDGSNNNRVAMFVPLGATLTVAARIVAGGVSANPANSAAYSENAVTKAAVAYSIGANQGALCVNGAAPSLSSPVSSPTGVNAIRIGAIFGVNQLGGWMQKVIYYNQRLANADLQTLTSISAPQVLSHSIAHIGLTT